MATIEQIWRQLQGTWILTRKLHSINAAEPSGDCRGTATFAIRQPAIFIDDDGVLQNATQEMLYTEQGEFEMAATPTSRDMPKFSFSRKYVWRLQNDKSTKSEISVWFVKPGTDQVDYLFHNFLLQHVTESHAGEEKRFSVECSGGHVCVEDFYSSTYTFQLYDGNSKEIVLQDWDMLHEVRGPKKDQVIETHFSRK